MKKVPYGGQTAAVNKQLSGSLSSDDGILSHTQQSEAGDARTFGAQRKDKKVRTERKLKNGSRNLRFILFPLMLVALWERETCCH